MGVFSIILFIVIIYTRLLTLGAHAQRGLQYLAQEKLVRPRFYC